MCHKSVLDWIPRALSPDEICDAVILEVGSYDVNGSVRPYITDGQLPDAYVGVDIAEGPGVDKVVRADELVATFGRDSFDIVISTEMMEHVVDWQVPIVEMVEVLRPGGLLVISTRSPGFPYHPYPIDTWRYTLDAMRTIMDRAGLDVMLLEDDWEQPGVFVKARKPEGWVAPWKDTTVATIGKIFQNAGVIPMQPSW